MQRSPGAGSSGQRIWRKVLRALNGAGIGAVVGGILGASLALLSATIIGAASGNLGGFERWAREWQLYALLGAVPGVPAGFLLGTTIIIRRDEVRVLMGTVFGIAVGVAYAWMWIGALRDQWAVLSSIVISGALGGAALTLLLTAIRRRWGWWTRWEA